MLGSQQRELIQNNLTAKKYNQIGTLDNVVDALNSRVTQNGKGMELNLTTAGKNPVPPQDTLASICWMEDAYIHPSMKGQLLHTL